MVKFLDLRKQYLSIKQEVDVAIEDVISSTAFVGGRYVSGFEKAFAVYQGVANCLGVGNGTDALEIGIEALNLPKNSEILVPANSFIASSEAVTRVGHKVVFTDCNPTNYTLDIKDARRRIGKNTQAVMAVHLYGHPCDMDGVLEMAHEFNLKVIEDCAQAHGARYKGEGVGSFGDFGAFSFYPGKNLGAYGDGGAIVSQDASFLQRCQMIANHGRLEKFDHEIEGRNSRLDGLQAAILSVKLRHLAQWIDRRNLIANRYRAGLSGIDGLVLPNQEVEVRHAYHLFVIRSPQRGSLQAYLKENGIHTGIHYPTALPKLRAYQPLGQDKEAMIANQMDQELLSLPMGDHLEDAEVDLVIEKLRNYF
jgi:dTDP-4-amino-4,6-dideoxygalactose transaminase